MAEPDQPKKETVRIKKETDRIELPRPPLTPPPEPSVKPRQTVRIRLPTRETGGPPSPSSPQSAPRIFRPRTFPRSRSRQLHRVQYPLQCVLL
jgi:hypothetical protein